MLKPYSQIAAAALQILTSGEGGTTVAPVWQDAGQIARTGVGVYTLSLGSSNFPPQIGVTSGNVVTGVPGSAVPRWSISLVNGSGNPANVVNCYAQANADGTLWTFRIFDSSGDPVDPPVGAQLSLEIWSMGRQGIQA